MSMLPGTFQKDLKAPVGQTSIAKRFPATRALKVLLPFVGQQFFVCFRNKYELTARTLSTRKTFPNGRVARNHPKGSQGARRSSLNCQKVSGHARTEGVDAIRRPTILLISLRTSRQLSA